MSRNALIYFMKAPVVGCVKTRLAQSIGDDYATTLYRMMCRHLLCVKLPQDTDVIIAYDDDLHAHLPAYVKRKQFFFSKVQAIWVNACTMLFKMFFLKIIKGSFLLAQTFPT